jgi:Na+/H+-translocating membrane pyrophosphatase
MYSSLKALLSTIIVMNLFMNSICLFVIFSMISIEDFTVHAGFTSKSLSAIAGQSAGFEVKKYVARSVYSIELPVIVVIGEIIGIHQQSGCE